jgi:hypothetical protein
MLVYYCDNSLNSPPTSFLHWKGWDLSWQTVFLTNQHFMCMEQSAGTVFMYGEVKILILLNISIIHWRSMCGVFWWKQSYQSFLFLRTYGDWWHFSGYDGEQCIASCTCGNSFTVRWCTTSLLPSCSRFLGRWVSLMLGRKKRIHSLAPSFFRYDTSGIFILAVCKT